MAVVAFLLTPDAEARWLRHLLQGNIEPVTAALCVWAVRRHLDGRPGQAVVLGALAGLTRPETWPFLLLYAAWLLWQAPRRWWVLVPGLLAVPVLWFGGSSLHPRLIARLVRYGSGFNPLGPADDEGLAQLAARRQPLDHQWAPAEAAHLVDRRARVGLADGAPDGGDRRLAHRPFVPVHLGHSAAS